MRKLLTRPGRAICCLGLMLGCLLTGCATTPQSSADAPPVSLVPDNRVILDPAVVIVDGRSLDISGSLHRQPTLSGPLSGRVDIDFIAPNGEILDQLPALIVPHQIESGKTSTYHTSYAYIPPKGSTLRIHFVDSDTESREDIAGEFSDYGGGGKGGGGGGGGEVHSEDTHGYQAPGNHEEAGFNNHYNGHGGSNSGFGNGFGSVNFSPNGRR